jgi:uncharacterized membrane protein YhhN
VDRLSRSAALVSALAATVFLFLEPGPTTTSSLVAKGLSVSLLAVVAARQGAGGLATALAFSSAGDLLLEWDRQGLFVAGLSAFLLAHVVYIVLFVRESRRPLAVTPARAGAALAVLAGGVSVAAWIWTGLGALRVPVTAYMAVLLVMGVAAQVGRFGSPLVGVGAALFVASDSMIGVSTFGGPFAGSGTLIWSAYYLAQAAITAGWLRHVATLGSPPATSRRA